MVNSPNFGVLNSVVMGLGVEVSVKFGYVFCLAFLPKQTRMTSTGRNCYKTGDPLLLGVV